MSTEALQSAYFSRCPHGRRREYHLSRSIDDLKLMRKYALTIDQHIIEYFLLVEE